MDTMWPLREQVPDDPMPATNPHGLVLVGGCGTEGCEDCERELDDMEDILETDERGGADEMC